VVLDGHGLNVPDERGEPILDDTFLLLFHAAPEDATFVLPGGGHVWRRVLDTERGFAGDTAEEYAAGASIPVLRQSLWLLRREG